LAFCRFSLRKLQKPTPTTYGLGGEPDRDRLIERFRLVAVLRHEGPTGGSPILSGRSDRAPERLVANLAHYFKERLKADSPKFDLGQPTDEPKSIQPYPQNALGGLFCTV
jgi:hypothetical protein